MTLGELLCDLDRKKDAEEAYQEAIAIGRQLAKEFPNQPAIRHDLSLFLLHLADLLRTDRPKEAEKGYREVLLLWKLLADSKYLEELPMVHTNLGHILSSDRREEALAEYREALRIKPNYADAHYGLGNLYFPNQIVDAIKEYREVIRIQDNFPEAHCNLGNSLAMTGEMDEAIGQFRRALELNKDLYQAHHGLGRAMLMKGRLDQAIASFKEVIRLNDNAQAQAALHEAELLSKLNARLPAVFEGKDQPKSAGEALAFAQLCLPPYRDKNVDAVRFFSQAFAADPKLTENPTIPNRYNAACSAVLAGCGQGKDADKLDDKERAGFRRQAFDWLQADFAMWKELSTRKPESTIALVGVMNHWLEDTDFVGVRAEGPLAKLPEAERKEWQKFWADVAELLKRAQAKSATEATAAEMNKK
jgi:tetratricopeptide (TPR) repeat protein